MKRAGFKWILGLIILIVLVNIPPLKPFISLALDEYHYRYSTKNGKFTFVEFKAHDTKMMHRRFENYKKKNQQESDTTIFRLFKKNPIAFWRWIEYFNDERYHLPYKSWNEIKKLRGYDQLEYSNNFQDF